MTVVVIGMVLLVIVATTTILLFRRRIMQALVTLLFRVAFDPMVRVSTAALAPVFASLTLDKAQLRDLVMKVADVLQGQTVTYSVMGIYSAQQQEEIVLGVADILRAVLADFQITQSNADVGRLLDAVAARLTV